MTHPISVIAQRLGMSIKSLKRIARQGGLRYQVIDGVRCYDWDDVQMTIRFGMGWREKGGG